MTANVVCCDTVSVESDAIARSRRRELAGRWMVRASRIISATGSERRVAKSAMPSAVRMTDFRTLKAMIQTRSPGRRVGGGDEEGNVDNDALPGLIGGGVRATGMPSPSNSRS